MKKQSGGVDKNRKRKRSKSETKAEQSSTSNAFPLEVDTTDLPEIIFDDGLDVSDTASYNYEISDDEVSDSETAPKEPDSDDEIIPLDENTIGNVPIRWYDEYDHIGYNIEGEKIMRPEGAAKDQIDSFLDRDDETYWLFFT